MGSEMCIRDREWKIDVKTMKPVRIANRLESARHTRPGLAFTVHPIPYVDVRIALDKYAPERFAMPDPDKADADKMHRFMLYYLGQSTDEELIGEARSDPGASLREQLRDPSRHVMAWPAMM